MIMYFQNGHLEKSKKEPSHQLWVQDSSAIPTRRVDIIAIGPPY